MLPCSSAVTKMRCCSAPSEAPATKAFYAAGAATRVELTQFADLVGDAALLVGSGKDEMLLGTVGGACDQGFLRRRGQGRGDGRLFGHGGLFAQDNERGRFVELVGGLLQLASEGRLVAVTRHKDHLKVLASCLHGLVRLGQLGGEVLTRGALLCRNVECGVLPRKRCDVVHLVACAIDQHLTEQIVERLGRPWKVLACGFAHDDTAPILGEHLACFGVEQDERRDAAGLELLRELLLEVVLGKGQREPKHFLVVRHKLRLVLVARDEHNLKGLGGCNRLVGPCELRRKVTARGAPVR